MKAKLMAVSRKRKPISSCSYFVLAVSLIFTSAHILLGTDYSCKPLDHQDSIFGHDRGSTLFSLFPQNSNAEAVECRFSSHTLGGTDHESWSYVHNNTVWTLGRISSYYSNARTVVGIL